MPNPLVGGSEGMTGNRAMPRAATPSTPDVEEHGQPTTHTPPPGAPILRRTGSASRPRPLRGATFGRVLTPTPYRRMYAPSRETAQSGHNKPRPTGLTRPRTFRNDNGRSCGLGAVV